MRDKGTISERDGFVIRFALAEDVANYYEENYCPLIKSLRD